MSRALRDLPEISEGLKLRVRETAELLNYIPNNRAANFRDSKTNTIGLIIPKMENYFTPSVIKGVSDTLKFNRKELLILLSDGSLESEVNNINTCCQNGVDGILLSFTEETQNVSHLEKARKLGIPIVIYDKTLPQGLYDEIVINDYETTVRVCEKLVSEKKKRVLGVFGNERLEISKERKRGFEDAMRDAKTQYDIVYAGSMQDAEDRVKEKIVDKLYDGVFAMSDETLLGTYSALVTNSDTLEGIKITSISTGILPSFISHQVACAIHDGKGLGKRATEVLLKRISEDKEHIVPHTYYHEIVFC